MKKIILILAVMAMTVVGMQAQQRVPAYPGLLESPQPNGYVPQGGRLFEDSRNGKEYVP